MEKEWLLRDDWMLGLLSDDCRLGLLSVLCNDARSPEGGEQRVSGEMSRNESLFQTRRFQSITFQ